MELIELTPSHIPQLTPLLNQHLQLVTPHFSLSEQTIQSAIFDKETPWQRHYGNQPSAWTTKQHAVVENNQLIAAGQWDIPLEPNLSGTISWIVAKPDKHLALDVLIQHFITQLQAKNCDEAQLTRFHFGAGWLGLPDIWRHLHPSLTGADFWVYDTWTVWAGDIKAILSNPVLAPQKRTATWDINPQKREWDLYLHHDGIEVGMCSAWGLPPVFDTNPDASEWMTIEYIEVHADFRRQHIATYMLQEQARYHAQDGIQNIILWIQQKNSPALNLVRSMGFTQQFLSHDYSFTQGS